MDKSRFGFNILIIFVFLFTIVVLGINSSLSIDEANSPSWDVSFGNVEVVNSKAYDIVNPIVNEKSTSINGGSFVLKSSDDSISYNINVINKGSVDAKITQFIIPEPNCSNLNCEGLEYDLIYDDGSLVKRGDILKSNEGKTIYLRFRYNGNISEPISVNDVKLYIDYKER